jgi:hypothetical protein
MGRRRGLGAKERPMTKRALAYSSVLLIGSLCASSLCAQVSTPATSGAYDPPGTHYVDDDADAIDPRVEATLPVVARHRAFLPVSADLSGRMPLPGNQGPLGSCTAWSTAYAARSYYSSTFEGRDIRDPRNIPSPNFVYHLARSTGPGKEAPTNVCPGTSFTQIVDVLKNGALSLAEFPYATDCIPPPSRQVVAKAFDFRVQGYRKIDVTKLDDVKGQLARSSPVLFSLATRIAGGPTTAIHAHRGSENFNDQSMDIRVKDGKKYGWHAMVLVGYDDRRQAFRLLNSWGQKWGDGGYAWISYDTFAKRVRETGVLNVSVPARLPVPQPPVVAVTPPPPKPPVVTAVVTPPKPPPPPPPPAKPPVVVMPPAPPAPPPKPPQIAPAPIVPLPPAPVVASTAATLADLQKLVCAAIGQTVRDGRTVLNGYVASDDDLAVVQRIAATVPNTTLGEVLVAPWPQCEALQTLAKPLTADDGPDIVIDPKGAFRAGETLRIEIKAPPQIRYVYVAYVQADGSVINLAQPPGVVPQPTQPGQTLIFGDGREGRQLFTVGPPYGREMIIALAAKSPLFDAALPQQLTERDYLSELRRALIYKPSPDLPDREVAASVFLLQTYE